MMLEEFKIIYKEIKKLTMMKDIENLWKEKELVKKIKHQQFNFKKKKKKKLHKMALNLGKLY